MLKKAAILFQIHIFVICNYFVLFPSIFFSVNLSYLSCVISRCPSLSRDIGIDLIYNYKTILPNYLLHTSSYSFKIDKIITSKFIYTHSKHRKRKYCFLNIFSKTKKKHEPANYQKIFVALWNDCSLLKDIMAKK